MKKLIIDAIIYGAVTVLVIIGSWFFWSAFVDLVR